MDIIGWIAMPLGYVMQWCYSIFNNYGLAIIFFTFLTKIVQLPLGIWIQYNSIKMVKIQPQINRIKAKFFGDNETIADEESKMYKQEKYNPFATLIPLIVQIVILLGVVAVIYKPCNYLFHMPQELINQIESAAGVSDNSAQLVAIQAIQRGDISAYSFLGQDIINQLSSINFNFLGLNMCLVPANIIATLPVLALGAPIIAGFTAWLLCFCQNKSNVLQAEQGKINQYGLMIVSVALSLYLGYFVPLGIALYWVCSNAFAIIQLYILNYFIPPKKYVDYEELEASRKELAELKEAAKQNKVSKEEKKREKEDYKRFFSIGSKHIVFYSEKSGFYKYYEDIIQYLLKNTNMAIHYITNDPNDQIFKLAKEESRLKPYYIGVRKMITLFMKLDADIVCMTTPDLDNMYLKRSMYRKDIEYIYIPHESSSIFFGFKDHAHDNFDTIFAVGPHIVKETRAIEKLYKLKEKTLVEFGYPVLEHLAEANEKIANEVHEKKQILIGPSWQEDNLLDSCIDQLIDQLYCDDYHIIVRPHPEYMKRYKPKMDALVEKYQDKIGENLTFELDFSVNSSIYSSDLLIADWSSLSLEFAFSTLKPVLFINTKPKIENENWEAVGVTPQDLTLRDIIGVSLEKSELDKVRETAIMLFDDNSFKDRLKEFRNQYYFNYGSHGIVGGQYLLSRLKEIQIKKKEEKKS